MAEKVRQHYVPQLLLRKFSSSDNQIAINLYNLQHEKSASSVQIKTQAQEKYYYGEDPAIEDFFGSLEGNFAPILNKLTSGSRFEDLDEIEFAAVLYFIGLFAFRTKTHVERFEDKLNSTLQELSKYFDDLKQFDFGTNRIGHPEPAAFLVASYLDQNSYFFDLEPYLIINGTDRDFIISDNPLVIHNPIMLSRLEFGLAQALIVKGLVVFFPISPKHCIMLADPWAYDVLCSGLSCFVDTTEDVDAINLLQALSGSDNVYFSDWAQNDNVEQICELAMEHKINEHINEKIDHPDKPGSKCLFSYYLLHKQNPALSFLRESSHAKQFVVRKFDNEARESEIVQNIIKNKGRNRK